jgi:hypothetical protein
MKLNYYLNNLGGWSRVGLIVYSFWVLFLLITALINSSLYVYYSSENNYLEVELQNFRWDNFIFSLITPILIWNIKSIIIGMYSWVKLGFIEEKKM